MSETPDKSLEQQNFFYTGIGDQLRQLREHRGLELDLVAGELKIRRTFIESIEEGRFQDLPGLTYAAGFVKTYAKFLDLDPEEAVETLRHETSGPGHDSQLIFPVPVSERSVPRLALALAVILLAALLYAGWFFFYSGSGFLGIVPPLPERLSGYLESESVEEAPGNIDELQEVRVPNIALPGPEEGDEPASGMIDSTELVEVVEYALSGEDDASVVNEPTETAAEIWPDEDMTAAEVAPAVESAEIGDGAEAESSVMREAAAAPIEETADTSVADEHGMIDPAPGPFAGIAASDFYIRAAGDVWVRIVDADDDVLLMRVMLPGEIFEPQNSVVARLTTGDAGALHVYRDGEAIAPLGQAGTVIRNLPLPGVAMDESRNSAMEP